MNALALLNNFEREFARPFFHINELSRVQNTLSSSMEFDEKNSRWSLTVELAGVAKENVKIDTQDNYLQVSGEKTKGVSKGKFDARYRLPEDVDLEKVEARFEDGILTVDFPLNEKKATKTIQIK